MRRAATARMRACASERSPRPRLPARPAANVDQVEDFFMHLLSEHAHAPLDGDKAMAAMVVDFRCGGAAPWPSSSLWQDSMTALMGKRARSEMHASPGTRAPPDMCAPPYSALPHHRARTTPPLAQRVHIRGLDVR